MEANIKILKNTHFLHTKSLRCYAKKVMCNSKEPFSNSRGKDNKDSGRNIMKFGQGPNSITKNANNGRIQIAFIPLLHDVLERKVNAFIYCYIISSLVP